MRNSFLIWIPSLQQFHRFFELTVDQLRCLLKIIDEEEIEFVFLMNKILRQNMDGDIDIDSLTTIDRFVIFLFLKIHSCSTYISLSKKCEKCSQVTNIRVDLNNLVTLIAPKIDKQFATHIPHGDFIVECNIPSLKEEYGILYFNKVNNIYNKDAYARLNEYILSHVKKIYIKNTEIVLGNYDYKIQTEIFNKLPAAIVLEIQRHFLNPIHNDISDISFLDITCKCGDRFTLSFDVKYINDMIKLIFRDYDFRGILRMFSSLENIDTKFIASISPMELDVLYKMNTEAVENTTAPQENDMFAMYKNENAHLQESASEFTL